jgi:hypothetical protein
MGANTNRQHLTVVELISVLLKRFRQTVRQKKGVQLDALRRGYVDLELIAIIKNTTFTIKIILAVKG